MAKRGPPFRTDVKASAGDVRQAMADVDLEKRSRNHISPGAMKTFVHDESVRTGICRTKQTVWKVASIGFLCGLRRARI
jgi:hypothetical protein